MALAENRKRARSNEEKEARKLSILAAARDMIDESGFDGVTMSGLAKRAGVSKGTLYLYVRTKEEVFLELFVAAMGNVTERLLSEATRDTFIDVLTQVTLSEPLYTALLARLAAAIEANVADEPLFDAKRRLWGYGAQTAAKMSELYGIGLDEAGEISQALMIAMQGAAHFDITAQRPPHTVPEDMQALYASQAYAVRFPATARLIMSDLF